MGETNSTLYFRGVRGTLTECVCLVLGWKWLLMQSSMRAMRPVATMTLRLLDKKRLSWMSYLLGDISECLNKARIGNPHRAWRHPFPVSLSFANLRGRSKLGDDVSHRMATITLVQVV